MPSEHRQRPVILSQISTIALPRWLLWLVCTIYVFPGFIGRNPWKNLDITTFGVMHSLTQAQASWLHPTLYGSSIEWGTWLPYWLGAGFMMIWPSHPELAARLPFMLGLAACFWFVWQTCFRLSLSPQAQPIRLAFGGEAQPIDYARAIADASVLAMMASFGLAQLGHETTPYTFQMLGACGLMHGITLLWTTTHRPLRSAMCCVFGCITLGLSGGAWLCLMLLMAAASASYALHQHRHANHTLGGCLVMMCALLASPYGAPTPVVEMASMAPIGLFKLLMWFGWPTWLLACWGIWHWRRQLTEPHILIALMFLGVVALYGMTQQASQRIMMVGLPALSILAALALPTLKRHISSFVDWLSVLFFSTAALLIWIVWLAMQFGVPERTAANIARLAPGFKAEWSPMLFGIAVGACGLWMVAVRWRTAHQPSALWKSMILPACGSTLCWTLLMTLWLPLLNFARSYEHAGQKIAAQIHQTPQSCTYYFHLSPAQIAGLSYYAGLALVPLNDEHACNTLITTGHEQLKFQQSPYFAYWNQKTRINRLTDNKEHFLIYEKNR